MSDRPSHEHLSAERMQAFLDRELSRREAAEVEEHLSACPRCSAEVDGWRVLFQDLGQLRSIAPADGFSERVMSGMAVAGAGPHVAPELLHDFLDGALAARKAERVEAHLRSCPSCTEEVDAWIGVFRQLDALERLEPSDGFRARVLEGVELHGRRSLVARLRAGVSGLVGATRPEHVPDGILQDFVDGVLPSRAAARVEAHVDGCTACASELDGWRHVGTRLETLGHVTPSAAFKERVMTEVRIQQAARELAPVSVWWRAGAVARRLVPQTREAWAALSGVAVTPAVIVGLVAWAVFSHPTITFGSLASFMGWQVADLATGLFSGMLGSLAGAVDAFGVRSLVESLTATPLALVGVALTYTALCALALRVLYRNLFTNRSLRGRYAHAFFAW